jgi:hypothetical protein
VKTFSGGGNRNSIGSNNTSVLNNFKSGFSENGSVNSDALVGTLTKEMILQADDPQVIKILK